MSDIDPVVAEHYEQAATHALEKKLSELLAAGLPINADPAGLTAQFLATNRGARLVSLAVYNNNAATRYVQLFDTDSLPANGTVPVMVWPVLANTTLSWSWVPHGRFFQRGAYFVNSSTAATLTLSGADLLIDVQYS